MRQEIDANGDTINVYELSDVGPRCVNGQHVDLSRREKQKIIDQWNAVEAKKPQITRDRERERKIQLEERRSFASRLSTTSQQEMNFNDF